MFRPLALVALIAFAPLLSGCLVIKTVEVAADVTGAAIGAAGEVVEGAVDVVTPDRNDEDTEDDGKSVTEVDKRTDHLDPAPN